MMPVSKGQNFCNNAPSEIFSSQAEEDLMSATMKLDEMMAGLEEFLNSPPAKRKKVNFVDKADSD